ncbi:hypothetical protein FT641_18505 [Bacillus paranthracis]|uniref:hypothetical protein n=1 Tax=Bacillus paranthracis TaxID=2026186 RepID=UPI00187AE9F7|nr:hypothetical protein [Bacillus paranthracis]MBE7114444.1 hypothetical protein [Bacillus paranthracis]MBE7154682.1 hypothetical protein [Bacillus paranthracis]
MLRVDVVKRQGVSESDELIDCGMVIWSFDGGTCEVALPVLDLEKVRNVLEKQKTDKERKEELFSLWGVHQEKIELYLESAKAVADACKTYSVNRSGFADTYAKDDHWERVSHDAVDLEVTHASDMSLYHALDMVVNMQCKPKEEYQVWDMKKDVNNKEAVLVNITLKDGSTLKNCEVLRGTSFTDNEAVETELELKDWFSVNTSGEQERVILVKTQSPDVVLELEIKPSMVKSWEICEGSRLGFSKIHTVSCKLKGSNSLKSVPGGVLYKELKNGKFEIVNTEQEITKILTTKRTLEGKDYVVLKTKHVGTVVLGLESVDDYQIKTANPEDWMLLKNEKCL